MSPSDSAFPRTDIILLAAGRGRRLGMAGHKALVPVRDGHGTLALLLDTLTRLPVGRIHIVTGHEGAAVEAEARSIAPTVHLAHNSDPDGTEMLQSLAIALTHGARPDRDVWVLSADAIYAPQALARLLETPAGRIALAAAPCGARTRREIGVRLDGPHVCGLGPGLPGATHRMAHAVRWPVHWHDTVIAAAREGLRFQWQVLDRLLGAGSGGAVPAILAVPVAADAAMDLDTPADLAALRNGAGFSPHSDHPGAGR